MTFPALLAVATDPVIATHPIAQRVYLRVLSNLDFTQPRDVKGWAIAKELKVRPQTVNSAFDTLVQRGFLTDHGRSLNNVRRFTLAWAPRVSGSETAKPRLKRDPRNPSPRLRWTILVRDGKRCRVCGRGAKDGVKLTVDHVHPHSKGGRCTEDNLQTLCEECNAGKSNLVLDTE